MDTRFDKMIRRVGQGFYSSYIGTVRDAVACGSLESLIRRVNNSRKDIVTVEFRLRAMASAVRQGYTR